MMRTTDARTMAPVAVAARPCAFGHGYADIPGAWFATSQQSKQVVNLTKTRRLRKQPT